MNIRIAVPTYNRPNIFKDKTLDLIKRTNIPLDIVDVIIENEEQVKMYKDSIDENLNYVVSNTMGICEKRNFVRYYYKHESPNKYTFCMDDDIDRILKKDGTEMTDILEFIKTGFETCEKENATLFGICPLHNPFFLREGYSTNLNYIIGCFFGFIRPPDDEEPYYTEMEHWEDFDFSLAHFHRDGKIVRFNYLGLETKYFEPTGGITFEFGGKEARLQYANENAYYMREKWGEDCIRLTKNKWGVHIRLNHHYKIKKNI